MQLDPARAEAGADALQHGLERVRAARCLTHGPVIEHGAQLRVAAQDRAVALALRVVQLALTSEAERLGGRCLHLEQDRAGGNHRLDLGSIWLLKVRELAHEARWPSLFGLSL